MDNEMYDEMAEIATRIKQLEDKLIGFSAKRLTEEEMIELRRLTTRKQELRQDAKFLWL